MCIPSGTNSRKKMSGLYPTLEDMKVDQMAQVYSLYIVRLISDPPPPKKNRWHELCVVYAWTTIWDVIHKVNKLYKYTFSFFDSLNWENVRLFRYFHCWLISDFILKHYVLIFLGSASV